MRIKNLVSIFTLIVFSLPLYANDCVTGYACSIDGLKNQENTNVNKTDDKNKQKVKKQKNKKKDKKGIFVDGGEYNKPEYTEIFMKNIIMP